jgi:hypothetical protein
MRKVISYIVLLSVLIASPSCKKNMKAAEYAGYVGRKENGLRKVMLIDGFEFCMQYRPYDYIMLMESRGDFKGYDMEKRKADLNGTAWFSIAIKRVDNSISPMRYGISSIDEYDKRLNYFLNEAKKDIWLTYNNERLQPSSYLFENNYNLTPQETIMVGFILPAGTVFPERDMQLSYNDQAFKSGIIKATYSQGDLNNIPNLVYKN